MRIYLFPGGSHHAAPPGRPTGGVRFLLTLALLLAAGTLGGCSTTRLATRAMIPIIEHTRDFALAYPDVETFVAATPANLFLIEGMIASDPGNEELRLTASMLYFSYGFTAAEDRDPGYASYLYLQGLEHAAHILKDDKRVRERWGGTLQDFESILDRFDSGQTEAMVWAAANWAQFISLHLDSTAVLPDIPRVAALLERTCEIDGTYFMGLPHIILGILHAFRPPMLGGDPEKSLEHFTRAFEISDSRFYLCHFFYAKYYCHRTQEAEAFEQALAYVLDHPAAAAPGYRLLNQIAKDKALTLMEEKDDLF
jgi:hypothetical protein